MNRQTRPSELTGTQIAQPRWAYLIALDGRRCFTSNHYGDCGLNRHNQWAWIVGHMIDETGCNPDDVSCVETDDGDRIAINGKIEAELVRE